jgi:YebC/PmpR family DNA-binding regulatory protein
MNPRLRSAIDSAKAVSMPKDNIERAIKKGTGELGGETIQDVVYEGYGPAGIAFLIEVSTDNLNRSAAGIRSIFTKNGGSIATPGSVAYQFERKGEIRLSGENLDEEAAFEAAIEAGAEDMEPDEDGFTVLTAATELNHVATRLREAGHKVLSERLVSIPQNPTLISDEPTARKALRLYELLDDYDDTYQVFTNFEIDDALLASMAEE